MRYDATTDTDELTTDDLRVLDDLFIPPTDDPATLDASERAMLGYGDEDDEDATDDDEGNPFDAYAADLWDD